MKLPYNATTVSTLCVSQRFNVLHRSMRHRITITSIDRLLQRTPVKTKASTAPRPISWESFARGLLAPILNHSWSNFIVFPVNCHISCKLALIICSFIQTLTPQYLDSLLNLTNEHPCYKIIERALQRTAIQMAKLALSIAAPPAVCGSLPTEVRPW